MRKICYLGLILVLSIPAGLATESVAGFFNTDNSQITINTAFNPSSVKLSVSVLPDQKKISTRFIFDCQNIKSELKDLLVLNLNQSGVCGANVFIKEVVFTKLYEPGLRVTDNIYNTWPAKLKVKKMEEKLVGQKKAGNNNSLFSLIPGRDFQSIGQKYFFIKNGSKARSLLFSSDGYFGTGSFERLKELRC